MKELIGIAAGWLLLVVALVQEATYAGKSPLWADGPRDRGWLEVERINAALASLQSSGRDVGEEM